MKVYKCIDIYKKNNAKMFRLIDGDGDTLELNEDSVIMLMVNHEIKVINLTTNKYCASEGLQYLWDSQSIVNYVFLESTELSYESEKAYHKAVITNTDYYSGSTDRTVVITDRTRELNRDLYADTIIFIGNKNLINHTMKPRKLKCKHVIIKNRCLMGYIAKMTSNNNVRLIAEYVHIQHNFIDINTVNEIFAIILHRMQSSFDREVTKIYDVDFESVGIDSKDILDRTLKIAEENKDKCKSAIASASLACSMYVSTKRIYSELLETANKLIHSFWYEDIDDVLAIKKLIEDLKEQ